MVVPSVFPLVSQEKLPNVKDLYIFKCYPALEVLSFQNVEDLGKWFILEAFICSPFEMATWGVGNHLNLSHSVIKVKINVCSPWYILTLAFQRQRRPLGKVIFNRRTSNKLNVMYGFELTLPQLFFLFKLLRFQGILGSAVNPNHRRVRKSVADFHQPVQIVFSREISICKCFRPTKFRCAIFDELDRCGCTENLQIERITRDKDFPNERIVKNFWFYRHVSDCFWNFKS